MIWSLTQGQGRMWSLRKVLISTSQRTADSSLYNTDTLFIRRHVRT